MGEGRVVESEGRREKAKTNYTVFLESCRVIEEVNMITGLELQKRREIFFCSFS